MVGWRGVGMGAVTRLELTGPSNTLWPRFHCAWGMHPGPPGRRGWKASLLPGVGVSPGVSA